MIKIATVCSGIGAPEKALKNLGVKYSLEYFCEFDKFAVQSYRAIHKENKTKNLGDLTKVDIDNLPKDLDLIVGGTPCQDFSVAGKRAGGTIDSQTRSSLMWNFVEIIRETQPKVVVWENVPGCLSGTMKTNFYKFLTNLGELGYKITAEILNAKNFGVPQNRDRVFVVAIRKDLKSNFEITKGYDCSIRLKNVMEYAVDEKYYLSEKAIKGFLEHNKNHQEKGTGFIFAPKTGEEFASCLRANAALCATDNTLIELTKNMSQGNCVYDPNGLSVTLSANGGGQGAKTGLYQVPHGENKGGFREVEHCPTITTSAFDQNNFVLDLYNKAVRKDGLCGTLTTATAHNGNGTFAVLENTTYCINSKVGDKQPSLSDRIYNTDGISTAVTTSNFFMPKYAFNFRVRKLTPKECFRLMGFSDDDYQACKDAGISDSQLYKQAGNSIVVNVLMAIFGQLYGIDWRPIVYGKWWKTEKERYDELPLFNFEKGEQNEKKVI